MSKFSYPKEKIKVLLLENIHPVAIKLFRDSGYTNIESVNSSLDELSLSEKLANTRILGFRSKTEIRSSLLQKFPKLLTLGAYCIGTNQIDLGQATQQGLAVFNSPYSNTRSVAELVIGLSIMLLRKIFHKSTLAHQGIWDKESKSCYELRNKTIGIIGYGRIGSQVSVLAESLGMKVVYYDVEPKLALGNATPVSLEKLLKMSDIITLHVPENKTTCNMIGKKELKKIKIGAVLLNIARGSVISATEVAQAIKEGRLGGLAVDVFENEPKSKNEKFTSVFQNLSNTILTPHIGGSTEEAQENIGLDVTSKIINYLDKGISLGSLTVPDLNLPLQKNAHRFLHIHFNVPGVLSDLNHRLSALNVNILGQYLKTNEKIGYVVFDIDKGNSSTVLKELKQVKNTIRARALY
ncbi:MAG: D-3-phosphoglycerate dehydrogenase [Bacteroidetes bacterium RIFCSPLOWO2_02_FULL_36_8]|nr:MAG: D-3-phosphoglycerate dehydrogenase [Bacteroidetes bacterium RIFCSPLOWO2_02_FULL_36_8]OFY69285.1 MAG: D-3-phosphoglycerate dehydrogenase [Bacteroidetes bacterium RIFCSPLOWO2_12_FULL_37_12]